MTHHFHCLVSQYLQQHLQWDSCEQQLNTCHGCFASITHFNFFSATLNSTIHCSSMPLFSISPWPYHPILDQKSWFTVAGQACTTMWMYTLYCHVSLNHTSCCVESTNKDCGWCNRLLLHPLSLKWFQLLYNTDLVHKILQVYHTVWVRIPDQRLGLSTTFQNITLHRFVPTWVSWLQLQLAGTHEGLPHHLYGTAQT